MLAKKMLLLRVCHVLDVAHPLLDRKALRFKIARNRANKMSAMREKAMKKKAVDSRSFVQNIFRGLVVPDQAFPYPQPQAHLHKPKAERGTTRAHSKHLTPNWEKQ